MSLTLLTYNQPAVDCLIELINIKNNQAFTTNDLMFGAPVAIPDAGSGNTQIDVLPVPTSALTGGVTNKVTIPYERLDIGQYFEGALPVVYLDPSQVNADAILAALTNQYQIYTAAGANDGFTVTISQDGKSATIVPNPNHLVWIGQVTAIIDTRPQLSTLIPVTNLGGFGLPSQLSALCPLAEVFYGPVQGNGFINELQLIQSGAIFSQYLPSWWLGTELLQEPWYANTSPGPYNIYGGRVIYNGPAVGPYRIIQGGTNFSGWVLIIELGVACTNRCGHLVVLYNPPTQQQDDNPPIAVAIENSDGNLLYQ